MMVTTDNSAAMSIGNIFHTETNHTIFQPFLAQPGKTTW